MRLFCEALWVQKAGNTEAEYEDAFRPRPRLSGENANKFVVAVADGATESSFSGIWAKQLVRAYCHGKIDFSNISASLPALQKKWATIVARKKLPWYAEEKVRQGAFSSILGLRLEDGDDTGKSGSWHGVAVGDTCLVHIRGDELLASFPLKASAEFNNSPLLVGSTSDSNSEIDRHIRNVEGCWEYGDNFYLMTDAIANWFFREFEEMRRPWQTLRDLDNDQDLPFGPWIAGLRERKMLRNDDITLYRIDIS
jgi:hypothetical protein